MIYMFDFFHVVIFSSFYLPSFLILLEILLISPYSVRMRGNTDQKKVRIWTIFTQRQEFENEKKSCQDFGKYQETVSGHYP